MYSIYRPFQTNYMYTTVLLAAANFNHCLLYKLLYNVIQYTTLNTALLYPTNIPHAHPKISPQNLTPFQTTQHFATKFSYNQFAPRYPPRHTTSPTWPSSTITNPYQPRPNLPTTSSLLSNPSNILPSHPIPSHPRHDRTVPSLPPHHCRVARSAAARPTPCVCISRCAQCERRDCHVRRWSA